MLVNHYKLATKFYTQKEKNTMYLYRQFVKREIKWQKRERS